MNHTKQCPSCGGELEIHTLSCPKCTMPSPQEKICYSKKSGKTALFLCILLGIFGVHRFYVGKTATGIILLGTLGLFGIGVLIDLILITRNKFKDKEGLVLLCHKKTALGSRIGITLISIISTFALITGAFLSFANYVTAGLVNAVDGQLNELRQGHYKAAYDYNSEAYKKAFSLNYFTQWAKKMPELSNNKYAIFDKRGINSYQQVLDAGFLEGTLIANNGQQLAVKYILIKEHGTWKIVGIIVNNQPQ